MGASKNETILVIHGTFASEGDWWKPEGDFCKRLDKALEDRKYGARCWGHIKNRVSSTKKISDRIKHNDNSEDYFIWDDANSQLTRLQAGRSLARYLKDIHKKDKVRRPKERDEEQELDVHLIGHSHGGNVILEALRELDKGINEGVSIKSVTLLGTPIIESNKRRLRYYTAIKLAVAFTMALLIVESISFFDFSSIQNGGLLVELELVFYSILGILIWWLIFKVGDFLFLKDRSKKKNNIPGFHYPKIMRSILSRYDEPFHLLNAARRIRESRSQLAKKFSPLSFSPLAFKNRKPVREVRDTIAYNFRVGFHFRRVAFLQRLKALSFILPSIIGSVYVFVIALLDFTILRFISLGKSWAQRLGLKTGLKSIAAIGLGDDADYMPISGIFSEFPYKSSYGDLEAVEMPEKLEKKIFQSSMQANTDSFDNAYMILSEDHSDSSLLKKLEQSFSGENTVHCSYYEDDEIIAIIADIIVESDALKDDSASTSA